jgi:hypothetical protein
LNFLFQNLFLIFVVIFSIKNFIQMKNIFEIVKVVGLGLVESPDVEYSTGLLFFDKEMADKEADKLWKEQTTEDERKSGWCGLHFIVKKREVNS